MKKPVINLALRLLVFTSLAGGVSIAGPKEPEGQPNGQNKGFADVPRGPAAGGFKPDKDIPALGLKKGSRFKAFKGADLDKDGMLSLSEFSSIQRLENLDDTKRRRLFDFLDRDKDGLLQMRELLPREPKWIGAARREFDQLDTDDNGALDMLELSRLSKLSDKNQEQLAALFKMWDRDKNRKIERLELNPIPHHRMRPDIGFAKYDTNSSGGLDYAEYAKIPWMLKCPEHRRKKLFDRIDSDSDGEISKNEVRVAHQTARPGHRAKRPMELRGENRRQKVHPDPENAPVD